MTELSGKAVTEINRTFNSLTNSYATVAEYIAHYFPGETVWQGDVCGCTDDRCTGYHHEGSEECDCLDVQLNEFHDDLSVGFRIREWVATHRDQDLAVESLEVLEAWSRDVADRDGLDARLNSAQSEALAELFVSTSHLDRTDYITAVNRIGIAQLTPSTRVESGEGHIR